MLKGADTVVQPVQSPYAELEPIRAPVQVLTAPFLVQLPANVPEKGMQNGPEAWIPTHTHGRPGEALYSWLWPGLASAIAAT